MTKKYHLWLTGAGTYQEVHQAAMEEYFKKNDIPYVEVKYVLDDYSDIISASPDFNMESLDETGYESGGALKSDETNLAFILYETHTDEELATLTVMPFDDGTQYDVTVHRGTVTPKDVTYHIYFASMEEHEDIEDEDTDGTICDQCGEPISGDETFCSDACKHAYYGYQDDGSEEELV